MTVTTNTTTQFFTKRSNRAIKKVSEFEFIVEKDQAIGMRVPVRIYANENLISNMAADRTHTVRVIGISFVIGVSLGILSPLFGYTAGIGDILIGVTALLMA